MKYWIIGETDNLTSWGEDDAAEYFDTPMEAEKRAQELARAEPGHSFWIAKSEAFVKCDVASPQTHSAAANQ